MFSHGPSPTFVPVTANFLLFRASFGVSTCSLNRFWNFGVGAVVLALNIQAVH
jgi:hypothetical protein